MKLNRKNSLTGGMIYAKNFAGIYEPDAAAIAKPTVVDHIQKIDTTDKFGRLAYMECTGLSGDYFDAGIAPTWADGDEITICIISRGTDTDATFVAQRQDTTNVAFQLASTLSNTNGGWGWNVGSSSQIPTTLQSGGSASDGEWHITHVRALFGTNVQLFVDGEKINASPISDTRVPVANAIPMSVGNRWQTYPATAFEGDIDVAFVGVWRRMLSEAEIMSHAANPWQVFAPQRFFVPMVEGETIRSEAPSEPTSTVIITSVNSGTSTWQDGATGVTIAGSGFV
jgi:hypothetical protein